VAESDAAMVDEVFDEVENDSALPSLTHADVNLSRFAVTKVMTHVLVLSICSPVLTWCTSVMQPCQANI
jgi:hypothetical protein